MMTVRKLHTGKPITFIRSLHGICRGLPAVEVSNQGDTLRVWGMTEEINVV